MAKDGRCKKRRSPIAALALAALVLQGCSGTMMRYHYGDESDACFAFRDSLIAKQEAFDTQIREWTILGGAGGLAAGVVAVMATGNRNPLLLLAPALVGAVGGYLVAVNRQGVAQEELAAAVDADAATDRAALNQAAVAARGLADCRNEQMFALRQGIEAGSLSNAAAREQLTAIRRSIEGDREIVTTLLGRFADKVDIFAGGIAVAEEVEQDVVLAAVRDYRPTVVPAALPAPPAAPPAAPALTGPTTTMQASAGVNVRSGPSTTSRVVGTLAAGQTIETAGLAEGGTWYIVDFGGTRRYVHGTYLVPPGTVVATPAAAPRVDTTQRPATRNEVEQLAVEQKEVAAESEARFDTLAADLEALSVLLS